MTEYADLTIELSRPAENLYWVELTFSQPDGQTEQAPTQGPAYLDLNVLRAATLNPSAYGRALKEALFHDPEIKSFARQCLANAAGANQELRIRILIDRSAVELNSLRWETLRDLDDQDFLATNANLPFSRFLHSADWGRMELRSRGELRALVCIANPQELKRGMPLGPLKLAEVDVAGEMARARQALDGLKVDFLVRPGPGSPNDASPPTFDNLRKYLAQSPDHESYDIFYLVCHGAILPDEPELENSPLRPFILLEKEGGSFDLLDANKLVDFIKNLPASSRPRLVVLASCQSGGQGKVPGAAPDEEERSYDLGALAALGPRLVEAGVPAVVAMQDNIKMHTVTSFVPAFFAELLRHGQVDKAMAVARSQIKERPDWWVPVLYLRLRGGRLWYEPGFMSETTDFVGWPNIVNSVKQGFCVPILGFGLLEFLAGSQREIARRWAQEAGYPLDPHSRDEMPQVAQFLSIQQSLAYPRDQFLEHFQNRLQVEYAEKLGIELSNASLEELIAEIGKAYRNQHQDDPYDVLANLPFKIYITANPDNLLEQALIDEGRPPISLYSRWRRSLINGQAIQELKNLPTPTPEQPLVYHLFGYIGNPRSLVLTEDDYFEYMMWVNNPSAQIPVPEAVMSSWRDDALVFLGFQMNDWNFRVLFRSILNEERRQSIREYRSVAVQLQPGDGYLKPESARRYLERAFAKDQLDIFWGSGQDFLCELKKRWG